MKTRLAMLVSILVVVAAYGGNSRAVAKTYYVSTSGDDSADGLAEKTAFRTITHVAKIAKAGDTVKIKGGNYGHEHVVIQNSGTKANPIVFEGYGGTPVLDGAGGGGYGIDIKSKSHITINGLAITGYLCGILGRSGSSNITLRNITAYKNTLSRTGHGILFEYAGNNIVISNCTAYNNDMTNSQIRGRSANCLIENCKGYSKEGLGSYTDYDYAMADGANNNIIKDCTAGGDPKDGYDGSGHGFAFRRGASNNKVINCTSLYNGCEHYKVSEDSNYNEFVNCVAVGRHPPTRYVRGFNIKSSHNKVINCVAQDVYFGIVAYLSKAEPSQPPITGNLFENNILVNNRYGFYFGTELDRKRIGEETEKREKDVINRLWEAEKKYYKNNVIRYNNVWGNKFNYRNCERGTGDISQDPLFADPVKYDFHLKSRYGRWDGKKWVKDKVTSPCIDAGDPKSKWKNEPAPNGGRVNIGTYGNTSKASKSASATPARKGR